MVDGLERERPVDPEVVYEDAEVIVVILEGTGRAVEPAPAYTEPAMVEVPEPYEEEAPDMDILDFPVEYSEEAEPAA